MDVGRGQVAAFGLRLGDDLGADRFFDFRPVAIERRCQIVARRQRPIAPRPGRTIGILADVRRGVLQALEELLPFGIEGSGVLFVAGVDFVDVGGVVPCKNEERAKAAFASWRDMIASW
jgi:hypothetical protein